MPIFFILSIPTKAFSNTNLRFEQNILKNDFLELSLDNTWELYARIDSGLNIITASLSQGFSNEILLTAEYNASIFNFLDKKLEDDVKFAQLSGAEIIQQQYFLSANGSQAYGLHHKILSKGVTENYYTFHFDGTTTGHNGNQEQWLSLSILITDFGLSQSTLTYQGAKEIANKIIFPEGETAPNKLLPELENLQIGDSVNLDSNQTNNTDENIISLTRVIKNGPLSFSVSEETNFNILETYHEFDAATIGQYALINDPSQSISPAIAVGLNKNSQFSITADASYPATSMHIFTDFKNANLDTWASIQQASWKNSPNGRIFSSDYFTTNSGLQGISIIRETGITRDYYIGIDLSNAGWKSRNADNFNSDKFPLLRLQLSGFKDPVKNGFYPTALEIAKSIDFNQSIISTLPSLIEINTSYGSNSNQILNRNISDGPISFSIPENMHIDWHQAYIERNSTTKAQYNLNIDTLSSNIVAYPEEQYKTLEEWGSYQQSTWTSSEKGTLVSVQKFTNQFGHQGIAIIRQLGSIQDFYIVIDVTTPEWKQRYDQSENAVDDAWLRIQINGFQDPTIDGIYPTALSIAKSFNYETTFIPPLGNVFNETSPTTNLNDIDLNNTITDGPIEFLVAENTIVDFFENYNESNLSTNAKYNLSLATTDSFKSLIIESEELYSNLEEWAYYQKYAWENSDSGTISIAQNFTTDYNSTGVLISRENNTTRDFKIVIDLSNQAWKKRYNINSDSSGNAWLRAEFTSSNNPLYNPILGETLSSAKSLHFIEDNLPPSPTFREISPLTLFRAGKITANWYISDWFGTFYENNSPWIYHELLGWMYAVELTPKSGWFWHEGFDWIWTSASTYPYFYSFDTKNWLFFDHQFPSEKKYYDFQQNKWVVLDLLKKILKDYAGNEEETIIRIMKSSLREKEKLNGIGWVILYGN